MDHQSLERMIKHLHDSLSELRPPSRAEERLGSIVVTDRIDRWGRYHYIDPEAEDVLGFSQSQYYEGEYADQERKFGWISNNHALDRLRIDILWQRALAGHSVPAAEYRTDHTEGYWVWVEDSFRPVEADRHGRVLVVEGRWRDITPRKRRELEFLTAQLEMALRLGTRPARSNRSVLIRFPHPLSGYRNGASRTRRARHRSRTPLGRKSGPRHH